MGLAAKVEKLETVPEAQRGLYKDLGDNKGFVLDVDGAEEVFAAGLKANRDSVLTEKKKLEKKLEEFGALTPEEAKKLIEAKDKQAEEAAKASGQWDALKQQLIEKHNGDLSKATTREQVLLKVIERHLAEAEATRAITKLAGNATLLLPHVMKEIRVVEANDDFSAIVVGKDGKTPRIKNGSGDAMSIEDLVAEFKTRTEFGGGFAGSGASGSGAGGSGGGGGGGGGKGGNNHKISTADAKDNRKYVAAKEAATKAGVELDIVD